MEDRFPSGMARESSNVIPEIVSQMAILKIDVMRLAHDASVADTDNVARAQTYLDWILK